jgi:hypothetical protein
MPLHLVDYDQTPQRPERGHWFREPPLAHRVFEIEILCASGFGDLSGQSRLSTLTWPVQGCHGVGADGSPDPSYQSAALNQHNILLEY